MIEILSVENSATLAAARSLVGAHIAAHSAIHDAEAIERVVAALPAPYVAPGGGLWVAWDRAEALGCVALQALAPATAELKRMYVRPEARRRGVARRLSEHAIAVAAALGYASLRLGTLPSMRAAQQLYESLGFRRIAPYRAEEFGETWFYERELGEGKG
jgi:putative acetyltransferase